MRNALALLMLLLPLAASAEEKPWLVFSASGAGLYTTYRELRVYADGRVVGARDPQARVSPKKAATAKALLQELNRRGTLTEGAGHGRVRAHGGCVNPGLAYSVIWRPGGRDKAFSGAYMHTGFSRHGEPVKLFRELERLLPELAW